MDCVDTADIEVDNNLQYCLAQKAHTHNITANGSCHYCGTDLSGNRLFCGTACSIEFEKESKQKRMANPKQQVGKFRQERD